MSAVKYSYIQRYAVVTGKGISYPFFGMGIDVVRKLYDLVQSEKITNAESIKIDYAFNCEIVFKGNKLLKFLQKYYPEYLTQNSPEIIHTEFYSVSAVDYS